MSSSTPRLEPLRKNARWAKVKLLRRICDFKPEENLIISANERGGSTWLSELLHRIPRTAVYTEPLYLLPSNPFRQLKFTWNQYIPEDADWPEARDLFELLLRGKLLTSWTSSTWSFLRARRMVVKFCYANALLPWLTRNFMFRYAPICFVRHPFAIAASKIKFVGWKHDYPGFRIPDCPYRERYLEHAVFLSGIGTQPESLVAEWCLANLVTLNNPRNERDWITVCYETLLMNPRAEIERIFTRWGLPVPCDLLDGIERPSSTTKEATFTESKQKQLAKWRTFFSPEQIEAMMSVLDYFRVELYGADVFPAKPSATSPAKRADALAR